MKTQSGNSAPPSTKSFNARLRELRHWQQVAFAAALAQRSLINYRLFSEMTDFGDAQALHHLVDLLWESVLVPDAKINFAVQQENLQPLIPDPEQFDMYGVYPAIDAAMAVDMALELAQEADSEAVIRASKLSRSTVRQYLELTADDALEGAELAQWVRQQPLMSDENDFQDEVLLQVAAHKKPPKDAMKALRQLARNEGFSNLGLSLAEESDEH
ncbi:hypothetical protein BFW38_17370 [Terasakiispira papahanaumokuakeensis]|uniref:DUF416 domain-containing protein n=1 Tax=Terasakiispira papahanaumokuakeensis TaxID=197479 RepID=A0A1E2VDG8_9GAMM|nr:YjaG family protein [Terasakiispira papahanaumokuakeensis]ODC05039.1 hypothetical protein BFW38_17370 [Terasakiispira papahanaumokuakeensis]